MRVATQAAVCCAAGMLTLFSASATGIIAASTASAATSTASCGGTADPAAPSDFNGDGHADDAVGIPGSNRGRGAIEVLSQGHSAVVLQPGTHAIPAMTAGARFGSALSSFDLNGDKCSDLLVGIPDLNVGGVSHAGGVQVLIGGKGGLVAGPLLTAATVGVPGDLEADAHFGTSVSGWFERDGDSMIEIGVPGATVMGGTAGLTPLKQAGEAVVLDLADTGQVDTAGTDTATRTMTAGPQAGAHFGAVAQIGGGMITAPDAHNGDEVGAGYFEVDGKGFFGDDAGDQLGTSITFGPASVAADDFDGVFVGAPGHAVAGHNNAGEVQRYDFDPDDETVTLVSSITQSSQGVPGTARSGARFGAAIFGTQTTSDDEDVIIGAPGQKVGSVDGAGAVYTEDFTESGHGSGYGTRAWSTLTQATHDIPGAPHSNARFGAALTAFRTGVSEASQPRLIIGIPRFHQAGKPASGAIVAMPLGTRFPIASQAVLHQRAGGPKSGDEFGAALESEL